MHRAAAFTAVALLLALSLAYAPAWNAAADPSTSDNGDGTSDVAWSFTTPSDYSLANTAVSGGVASLRQQVGWWNSTTAADFAGPDSATNVDLAMFPGNVILTSTVGASTPITIQPMPAAGLDAYLDKPNPTTNHGGDTMMIWDPRGPTTRRPILEFSLASIPAGAVIDDAKLSLYESAAAANSATAEVHAVTQAWDEGQVTWTDRVTGTAWGTAGGDFDTHVIDVITLTNTLGWKTWNVTQLVDLWYRGRLANRGLILAGPIGAANTDKTFWSSDYAVDATLRPKLDVRYRLLGATGEYIAKVGGPGSRVAWQSISWNATERSYVSDAFDGASLNPKWTWTNPPASYDVGTTTPGSLRIVSTTGGDLDGATFTGNVLTDEVVGDFTAIAKISSNPTASGQKAGLIVLLNARNWYTIQKANVAGAVNWQAKATADAVSTVRANLGSGNPIPAYFRIVRSGSTLTASTSSDGLTWTVRDTYTPATEYPLEVRIGVFATDGLSGTAHTLDVDYFRVGISNDATVSVSTRLGDTTPVDASWTGWSAAYPTPSGSAMTGVSWYAEFRLSFTVTYPDHTPNVGDVNISWATYPSSGTIETADFAPPDLTQWASFSVVHALNGQTIAYEYSTDSGGSWTTVNPPASLLGVSTATGKIRFRASLSTADSTVTPTIDEMRLTYRHALDHFYVTASPTATAGSVFSVSVTAKEASNTTITWWTGTVTLDARLADGVTPSGTALGATSVSITSGGTATLATETYTKAETIRIRASSGSLSGLSDNVSVSPGPLDHVFVTPNDVSLLPFDSQVLGAQGYDLWNNPIPSLSYAWSVTGGVGSLNTTSGPTVNFTASPPPANGTVEASVGPVAGVAQIHVVPGTRPWVAFISPTSGAHLTGLVVITYTNSTDAVSLSFEYNDGSGWTAIGTTVTLNGSFAWDTTGLDFTGGSLRGIVTNSRTISNTTVLTPIEADNTPPAISLGAVADNQATSGTLTLTYTTSTDTVRVDLSYFDGAWKSIGPDPTIDGSYVWTPPGPINGVTIRALATDDVDLTGSAEKVGVGTHTVGPNPPSVQSIPTLHVRAGVPYDLNLTFYVSDADTPLSSLSITVADPANVTVNAGASPSLTIVYATTGTYLVTLWVSDGIDTAWVLLTILTEGTSPPAVVSTLPNVSFDEDTTAVNGFGAAAGTYFNDPDGDPLTFTVLGSPAVHYRVNAGDTVDFWADPNWFGSATMRLRATDPNGGFAEVAFLAVVRSVNDSPVLTAIPELSLEAGTTYVLDLGPYISDVDTPLAAITVTTDSLYVTVSGHILTLAFPSDWTSAEFQVTISDGSAIASQPVRVAFRITPPWWQAPYVLALPPIGVFVVVAMFAQRARWRPAKAFLVDERGRMIREFTLDPSCQVTYEQAMQAGALDAVEKPIKVAKYHAQTVRGDALAVVLLAYGPVTLEQVEFAREMLVQVQDKFEDAVKQRLEEARVYEATLETQSKGLREQWAAVDGRAGEVESMLRQVEQTQAMIQADVTAVETKDRDLKEREQGLAEEREAVDDLARQLEASRASLDERSTEIQEQAAEVRARSEAAQAREEAAAATEADLREREAAFAKSDAQLKVESDQVSKRSAEVAARLKEVETREAAVQREEKELRDARATFEADQKEVFEFKKSIDARVAEVEDAEDAVKAKAEDLAAREARIAPQETSLASREAAIGEEEAEVQSQRALADAATREVTERIKDLEAREAGLAKGGAAIEAAQIAVAAEKKSIEEIRRDAEARVRDAKELETTALVRIKAAQEREAKIAQMEAELAQKQQAHAERDTQLKSEADVLGRKAMDVDAKTRELQAGEAALAENRVVFEEARAAFETDRKEFQDRSARVEQELRRRREDLDGQAKGVGEAQLRLAQEKDTFEATRTEKSHAILSKEIELEAREQSIHEKEDAVRAQVEENGRRLSELAAREEALEIESARLDKVRGELDTTKTELGAFAKELEAKGTHLREEEARRAEELRTWQTTLESEQALLKEQRETFEQEMANLRASWADRLMRLEQREDEVKDHEAKVRSDVDWITRNEAEVQRREKAAADAIQSATQLKAEAERLKTEVEQRALEVESRERAIREEAARHAVELTSQGEALKAQEAGIAAKRADLENEQAAQTERFRQMEAEIQKRAEAVQAQGRALLERETRLSAADDALHQSELRVQREQAELRALGQQLDARQLEFAQLKEHYESEAARVRSEAESTRQSLAAKEAELRAERERIERDSTVLQETLGAKAKEMATREKALSARESELRAEEEDLEAKIRELETKERQAEARTEGLSAQAMALIQREQDLNARASQFEQTVKTFELEAAEKRREWETLQANLKSRQAQLDATAESRAAELAKRMEELEGRERTMRATMAQIELERSKLEAQAKAQAAKSGEADAAWQRSETRLAELKAKEDELLRARQSFESERAAWATKRAEELKQLEATRDAAGEQAQQAERLVAEAQRRAYVAEEAEKTAKRQAEQLAEQQALLDNRRAEAEKAERALQAQLAQLHEASQKFATKEIEITRAMKDLDARQAKLATMERDSSAQSAELKARRTSLDQEAARLAGLTDQLASRQKDLEARAASLETKMAQIATREQTLTTELQRADNLMEDLSRKEREIRSREEAFRSSEAQLAERDATLNARTAELSEAMRGVERERQELETQRARMEEDHRIAVTARSEADALKQDAEKLRAQADAMQAEVAKNLRFLQKKALDVLDREEKIRGREANVEQQEKALDARGEILEGKERALDEDRLDQDAKKAKLQAEVDRLRAKIADMEKAGGPTGATMDEWKKDMENRVKIIQKKAMELLDREEKMRKKEEELRALAQQLGVTL